jgi:hypothetical protein
VYPFVNHGLACPAIRGASSNDRVRPTTQKIPVFQFSTKVTWDTPFNVAIMNSFAVHLKSSLGAGLPLFAINSSFGGAGGAGHMSCPYLLAAYIIAQVVKMKDDVNPGIAHEVFVPFKVKRSPIRWENAIQVTAVTAAPKTDKKNVALFAFTKGPDQNAMPVKMELYPNRPKVTSPYGAPNRIAIPAPINPDNAIIAPAFLDAKNTPANIKIPVTGELNNGTSAIPLNNVKKKSKAGFPVE